MKNSLTLALYLSLSLFNAYAEDKDIPEVDMPLGEICEAEMKDIEEKKNTLLPDPNCDEEVKKSDNKILSENLQAIISPKAEMTSEEKCKRIMALHKIVGDEPLVIRVQDQTDKKWKIKFYFGNNKTWYGKSTAHVKTSRLDLEIKDLRPVERRSDSFYKVWEPKPFIDSFRWIDEPTNTFKFVVEHGKDEFFINIFHPKYVFVEGDQEFTGRHNNENVHVKGTADGQQIDRRTKLKGDFGPDDQKAFKEGNVYFVSWENSHMLLQPEIGYGKRIDLLKSKGKPIVTYVASASAGVFLGIQNASYNKFDKHYEYDEFKDEKMRIMGWSASVGNRLELHNRKNTIGAFVEHKFTYGKKKYAFLDGEVSHDIKISTLNFGVNATVITFGKDKKPKKFEKIEKPEIVKD